MRSIFWVMSFIAFLPCASLAEDLPPVAELQIASAFVWHIAHCDTVEDVKKFDATKAAVPVKSTATVMSDYKTQVRIDEEFETQLEKLLPELKQIRPGLDKNVRIIKQDDLKGEQFVIMGLTPNVGRQKYIRIHIINRSRPFVIDEIGTLSSDEVIKILNDKTIRIPQKPHRK